MERDEALLDRIASEATDWFTRLREPGATPAERERFTQWLLRSPDHINEYLAITRIWGDIDRIGGMDVDADTLVKHALAAPPESNVVRLAREAPVFNGASASRPRRPRDSRLRRYVAASICVICGVIGWLSWSYWPYPPTHVETRVGVQRTVSLTDGSAIALNTDSEVRIAFEPATRSIRLLRGEARFTVANDPDRPFVVITPNARVRALGTVFNVRASGDGTSVAVFEGRVSVRGALTAVPPSSMLAAEGSHALELKAGERATVLARGAVVANAGPPLERQRAWTDHRLVFRAETLATLVAEVNRYHTERIRIGDPAIASVLISGSFSASDLDSLLEYLEKYRGIHAEATRQGGYILLRDRD
jgi:transmembrane sensor